MASRLYVPPPSPLETQTKLHRHKKNLLHNILWNKLKQFKLHFNDEHVFIQINRFLLKLCFLFYRNRHTIISKRIVKYFVTCSTSVLIKGKINFGWRLSVQSLTVDNIYEALMQYLIFPTVGCNSHKPTSYRGTI